MTTITSFIKNTISTTDSSPISKGDKWFFRLCLWVPLLGLIMFFVLPMLTIVFRSFTLEDGTLGIGNYIELVHSHGTWKALINSLWLGFTTTVVTLLLSFVLAFTLERTSVVGRKFISACLILPLLAPSLVLGLGLIFLLGRNGLIGQMLGIKPEIYGYWGLLIANVMYALPQAVMILRASLRFGDERQYEAAEVIGANYWRQFFDITLPNLRYGALSAAFVVFTLTITDFGNAVVIGGNYSVLATEIYSQVFGQQKFGMGATVGLVLLLPAAVSVWIERSAMKRQAGLGAESAIPPKPNVVMSRDIILLPASLLIACSLLAVVGTVVYASFIYLWPYKMEFSFRHYAIKMAGGYSPLWTSLAVSAVAAVVGTILLASLAFSVRRLPPAGARVIALLSALPVGVPGLVLGLSYVFMFNTATWPWGALYGSLFLIAMCNFYHYHTQAYVTMVSGVRMVPPALEDACSIMGGSATRVIKDVVIPVIKPSMWAVALFLFMRSMVTLSAVIFLVTPSTKMAAVTVMRLDEAGFTSQAAAFSTCIMLVVGISTILFNRLAVDKRN